MSLAQLRQQTADAHQRIEKNLNIFELVRTRQDYRAHLEAFYSLYQAFEPLLEADAAWKTYGFDWQARRKLPLLHQDLRALGTSADFLSSPPAPPTLPPHASFAERVGSAYVLEGSTLGAQFISRHFANALALRPDSGLAYHTGYGAETGARWKEFCAVLEKIFRDHPAQASKIYAAAEGAFRAVEECLLHPSHEK